MLRSDKDLVISWMAPIRATESSMQMTLRGWGCCQLRNSESSSMDIQVPIQGHVMTVTMMNFAQICKGMLLIKIRMKLRNVAYLQSVISLVALVATLAITTIVVVNVQEIGADMIQIVLPIVAMMTIVNTNVIMLLHVITNVQINRNAYGAHGAL